MSNSPKENSERLIEQRDGIQTLVDNSGSDIRKSADVEAEQVYKSPPRTQQRANRDEDDENVRNQSTQQTLIQDEEDNIHEEEESKPRKTGPVAMPAVGKTFSFPRADNIYKTKESNAYDEVMTQVWRDRPKERSKEHVREWSVYVLIGVLTGTIAYLMISLEKAILYYSAMGIRYYTRGDCTFTTFEVGDNTRALAKCDIDDPSQMSVWTPWIFFAGTSGLLAFTAGIMTTYYGPGAAGSGVAELIGYLNGINYPNFIGIDTLLTKAIGVTFAVNGKLCIGKEGPLAHIGGIAGVIVPYLPFGYEYLQNDEKRRTFIAAGASAGVSVAFGAPIGGALFAYEMSRPNTFWRFSMIWKVFVSCAIANFWVSFLNTLYALVKGGTLHDPGSQTSVLKFGSAYVYQDVNALYTLPGAIILGVIGGATGALFINVNTRMAGLRKIILTKKWMKPFETFFFAFVTASFFYWLPRAFNKCIPIEIETKHKSEIDNIYRYIAWCGNGTDAKGNEYSEVNALAAHFWSGEGEIIKNILSLKLQIGLPEMISFISVWYLFTITTYGTNVPAGLFLPGMIIGCCMGDLYFRALVHLKLYELDADNLGDEWNQAFRRKFIVIGTGAFMAGYTRMTYALGVILMETSEDLSIFVPLIFTIVISNQTGYKFTRSLYERATRTKQMPILTDKVPNPCKELRVGDIMTHGPITFKSVETMANIQRALSTNHHAFPIVNHKFNLIGVIPRNFLIVLLQHHSFYAPFARRATTVRDSQLGRLSESTLSQNAHNTMLKERLSKKSKYKKIQLEELGIIPSKTNINFSKQADDEEFQQMPEVNVLPWQCFTRNFVGKDLPLTNEIKKIVENHTTENIDFRPYMNDNPMTVCTTDSFYKCADVFRKMHLRHLCVLHPTSGSLEGIVTRQDIFKWMDL